MEKYRLFSSLQLICAVARIGWAFLTRPRFPDFILNEVERFFPDLNLVYQRTAESAADFLRG